MECLKGIVELAGWRCQVGVQDRGKLSADIHGTVEKLGIEQLSAVSKTEEEITHGAFT